MALTFQLKNRLLQGLNDDPVAFNIAAFYTGGEHAQAEYRTIYTNYSNKRSNTPAAITGVYTFSSVTDYGLLSTHWAESTSTYHT